ncbi:MAG: hypothetical protein AB7P13_15620 [Candidatus Nitrosocosmicus sp.]
MPKTRDIRDYPWQAYYALFEKVAKTKERISVVCEEGRIKPMSLRGEVYAWRRACMRDEAKALELGIQVDLLEQVVVTIGEGVVHFVHKDNTGAAAAVLQALAEAGVQPVAHQADANASLAETLKKLGLPGPGES